MKTRNRKKYLKMVAVLSGMVLMITLSLVLLHRWESGLEEQPASAGMDSPYMDNETELTFYNGAWYAERDDLETVLILGVDKFASDVEDISYNNSQQADFLLLLVLDQNGQSSTAIQLNRDTMTEINMLGVTGETAGTFEGQLALAHTYGSGGIDSCENTVDAVSNLLFGIEVDHYLSFTMDAVSIINDLAGGVTVEVMDDLTFLDPVLQQGSTVTLTGEQALQYVRNRKGLEDSTNLHRMERQRQYLSALHEQISICMEKDADFLVKAMADVSSYLVSDCTLNQLVNLADQAAALTVEELLEIPGETVLGEEYMEFYPNESELQELVVSLFYTKQEME